MRIDINGSFIEIVPIKYGNSKNIIGYGTWLSQGNEFDPTEYYIGYHDLDLHIIALQKIQIEIKRLMENKESEKG